jgi:thiol:disulfide interchange protein DsbC
MRTIEINGAELTERIKADNERHSLILPSLTALTINTSIAVVCIAITALLAGCASPKYEVVRTDRWIVKDGWVVGEKDKPNARQAQVSSDKDERGVREEKGGISAEYEAKGKDEASKANDDNGQYCDNDPKQLTDSRRFDRNIGAQKRFNATDRNATDATLALYKHKPIEAIEEAWVRSVLPNTQIELIRRSPAIGFYTAFLSNGQIIYVNPSQRLLFFGEIYSNTGDNLTNLSKERFSELRTSKASLEINASELERIGFGDIGKEERYIAMVTSPLCPYCHKADAFLSANGISVKRIFLVDTDNPDDEGAKRSIEFITATSKETREALLVKWRSAEGYEASKSADGAINKDTQEAIRSLEAMREFSIQYQIEGTPYLYLVNRKTNKVDRLITGYAESTGEQIKAWYRQENKPNQASNGDKQ